jgi:hypothetical protein
MILRNPVIQTRRQQKLPRPIATPMRERHLAIMTTPPPSREHPGP